MPDTGPLPEKPLRIDELFAFIAVDSEGEGITAFPGPIGWMPMIGADMARIESLRVRAQDIANAEGREIKLFKFGIREELEVIQPSNNKESK